MTGHTIGRSTRRFRRLAAELRSERRPCCHCGQRIDYSLPAPHRESFTVEHIKPWSTHPELREDPANLDAAHWGCNSSRGNSEGKPGLGDTSRQW